MHKFIIGLFILLLMPACSYKATNQEEADQLVASWHKSIQQGNFDTLPNFYDASFFKEHPQNAWKAYWIQLVSKYGPLREVHQTFSQKDARYRGDYYMYGFKLVFDHGTAKETITVFKGIEQDKVMIVGHFIEHARALTPSRQSNQNQQ